ncbi:PLDc N-terminal domain-containing protein [Neptunitalea lumnitzerae]|uniref:Cardiolipin synthase N-terminal domain-containing protein n=1 Tax=Neptunitalea lumnitzerae TaxID=2965509 RepID=A0ABQ5MFC6_9FLAO|nr:PLDc N-terminal domain-containing protein [Neptunitalea sp. Y10]GLB48078.1 hypothetical protein Y10_04460 [Neptunitalea sp. Y10]
MIGSVLLVTAMFFVLYSLFHLIVQLVDGKSDTRDMLWFWVIILLPVVGSVIYFSYRTVNAKYKVLVKDSDLSAE